MLQGERLLDFTAAALHLDAEELPILDQHVVNGRIMWTGKDLLDGLCFQWRVKEPDIYLV